MIDRKLLGFAGFSLDYRLYTTDTWPKEWRCRVLPNAQTRQDYKVTGWGGTAEEAMENALTLLEKARD